MLIVVPAAIGYGLPVTFQVMKKKSWCSKAVAETWRKKVANKVIHSPKKGGGLPSFRRGCTFQDPYPECLPKSGPNQPQNPTTHQWRSIRNPRQGTCTKEIVIERSEEVGWCNRRLPKKDLRTVRWKTIWDVISIWDSLYTKLVFSSSQEGSSS